MTSQSERFSMDMALTPAISVHLVLRVAEVASPHVLPVAL